MSFASWYQRNAVGLEAAGKIMDVVQKAIVIVGIPFTIYSFVDKWDKDRAAELKDRQYQELQTYVSCKDLWWKYLEEYLRTPDTNFGPFSEDASFDPKRDADRDDIFVNYQFTLFERVFLFFNDKPEAFRKEQWEEWKAYIVETFKRNEIRKKWSKFGWGYDKRFQAYVGTLLQQKDSPRP